MKKIYITFFCFILIVSCALFEKKQVISGTVVSKISNEPMEGVKVHIKNTDINTLTDSTGFYSIPCKDFYTFQLDFIHKGYDTTRVDVVLEDERKKYEINVALEKYNIN